MHTRDTSNIETLRAIAVLLLVSYHVIGSHPSTGLELGYPAPARLFADGLVDIRMPLFAFIAGWVYALRPIGPGSLRGFLRGKTRRLLIPGLVASLTFWVFATFVVPGAVGGGADLVDVVGLSYVHFWFLQAILIVLVGVAALEAASGAPLPPLALATGIAVLLVLPGAHVPHLELHSAHYLAPYFLAGILFHRTSDHHAGHRTLITGLALAALVTGLALNLDEFVRSGRLSTDRNDLQSLLTASGALLLLALYVPRIPALSLLGPVSFTIYLYHVFGTSGLRRAGGLMGIDDTASLFFLSLAGGLLLPILFHAAMSVHPVTRALVLGLWPVRPDPRAPRSTDAKPLPA